MVQSRGREAGERETRPAAGERAGPEGETAGESCRAAASVGAAPVAAGGIAATVATGRWQSNRRSSAARLPAPTGEAAAATAAVSHCRCAGSNVREVASSQGQGRT